MELLATKMVASSFFGRSSSEAIICIAGEFSSRPLSIFDLVKENTATSAPEIKAEHVNSIKSKMTLVINEVFETRRLENKTEGSGSKITVI